MMDYEKRQKQLEATFRIITVPIPLKNYKECVINIPVQITKEDVARITEILNLYVDCVKDHFNFGENNE